mgnify:CR=1 FL=1
MILFEYSLKSLASKNELKLNNFFTYRASFGITMGISFTIDEKTIPEPLFFNWSNSCNNGIIFIFSRNLLYSKKPIYPSTISIFLNSLDKA